jgi:energy-coupling factor transporter ATP-binding protein EcfA2
VINDGWLTVEIADLPAWLRATAVTFLEVGRQPDTSDIGFLADLAIQEATGPKLAKPEFAPVVFNRDEGGTRTAICGLQSPSGIGALSPTAQLDFAEANLVIVYGQNGSGKSSYARILKHATGRRPQKPILSNVFNPSSAAMACGIRVRNGDGSEELHTWTPDSDPHEALRGVHIFDSDVAHLYLQQAMEASYEPRALRFISQLVDIATAVSDELKRRIADQTQPAPQPPQHLAATKLAEWLRNLKLNITAEQLNQKLAWTEADSARKANLEDALRQPNPAEHLAKVKQDLLTLERLQVTHAATLKSFSDDAIRAIAAARTGAVDARQAVEDLAKVAFAATSLSGVGERSWRAMWDAARDYTTKFAYPTCEFPHVGPGAKCPLCQQPLDAVAAARLTSFDAFVKNQLEAKAKLAEGQLQALVAAVPVLPSSADWQARYSATGASEALLQGAYAALSARHRAVSVAVAGSEIAPADLSELSATIGQRLETKKSEFAALEAAAAPDQRPVLTAELNELKTKEWASGNLAGFEAQLARMATLCDLEAAKKLCSTTALTKTKGELAEVEVEKGYVERFKAELAKLGGGRLKVLPDVKQRKKGKVLFHLKLDGANKGTNAADVLSEGEARIVALATFLADLTVSSSRSPFIFDDPISSLDQEFEERVVARLVELAQTRQVVVFTHRLSFLGAVREAAKKPKESGLVAKGTPQTVYREIALRSLEGVVGLATETNVLESNVDKALNGLLNERVARARKEFDSGDLIGYQSTIKAICSDFRILVERSVEEQLLGAVVLRFRREVQTKNKLASLALIELEDCILLDRLMTDYSCFEHSQPREIGQRPPDLGTLSTDISALKEWLGRFDRRRQEAKVAAGGKAK